ncbi:MAG: hypothetical protein HYT94_03575 [Parcubacteria group bacterium]|nr:hypothetical protein [Parcubacteria group bacterium]
MFNLNLVFNFEVEKMSDKMHRITADFSEEAYQVLSKLKLRFILPNKAQVLCKALGTLDYLSEMQQDGWKIVIEKGDRRKELVKL